MGAPWHGEQRLVDGTVWARVGDNEWQAGRFYCWLKDGQWFWKRLGMNRSSDPFDSFEAAARAAIDSKRSA